jgi:hypothetical protein
MHGVPRNKCTERFGEDVCKLLACADVLDVDLPGVDAVADEVEVHLSVLASITEYQNLA